MAKKKLKIKANGGTNPPIKGTKEQYENYLDSLRLYQGSQNLLKKEGLINSDFIKAGKWSEKTPSAGWAQAYINDKKDDFGNIINNKIKPEGIYYSTRPKDNEDVVTFAYKKPVQPIIYQSEAINPIQGGHLFRGSNTAWNGIFKETQRLNPIDLLRDKPINIQSAKPDILKTYSPEQEINPIPFVKGSYFTRDAQQQEIGGKEYYDIKTGRKLMEYGGELNELDMKKNGGIHINPKNKGKFNATKKATGKTTEELTHSKNPVTKKRAIFAQNAAKWNKKEYGGYLPMADDGLYLNPDNIQRNYWDSTNPNWTMNYPIDNVPLMGIDQNTGQISERLQGQPLQFNPNGQTTDNQSIGRKKSYVAPNIQGFRGAKDSLITGLTAGGQKIAEGDYLGSIAAFGDIPFLGTQTILEEIAKKKVNSRLSLDRANQFKDAQTQQSLQHYSDEQYGNPYFQGLGKYGKKMENGGINDYKSYNNGGMANVEAEEGEQIFLPTGLIEEVKGKTHAEGGEEFILPTGAKIFSEHLKHPIEKKSYAKLAKKFETKKEFKTLEEDNKFLDDINKETINLNIQKKTQLADKLFQEQEEFKLAGKHGKKAQKEAFESYQTPDLQMKNGGLMKAKDGWEAKTYKTPAGFLTPTGVNLNTPPLTKWGNVRDIWTPVARKAGYLQEGQTFKDIADLQQFMYDYKLDSDAGKQDLRQLWKNYGVTNLGEQKGYSKYDVNNLNDQQLNDLRAGFIDAEPGKRVLFPNQTQKQFNFKQPQASKPSDIIQGIKGDDSPIKGKRFNARPFPVPIPFNEPYLESPIPRYKFNPYLNEYHDVSPDYTEIDRQYQGALTNDPRVNANLFSQALQAKNSQYFNTSQANKQGRTQIDSQNNQILGNIQTQQYGENNTYRDLVSRMRGNIGTQQLLDRQAGNQMYTDMRHQYDTQNYLSDVYDTTGILPTYNNANTSFSNLDKVNYKIVNGQLVPFSGTDIKKMGGKVKLKVKRKK